MGELTLTEFKDQVHLALGSRSEMNNRLLTCLNQAQSRIARAHRWEELKENFFHIIEITDDKNSDKKITLPEDIRDIYTLRVIVGDGRSKLLEFIPFRFWDQYFPEPEYHERRLPRVFTIYGRGMELFPVPDDTYELKGRMDLWPTSFTDDKPNAVSDFRHKDDIILNLAISIGWRMMNDHEKSKEFFGIANGMLKEAVREAKEQPAAEIKPMFETVGSNPSQYWADPWVRRIP